MHEIIQICIIHVNSAVDTDLFQFLANWKLSQTRFVREVFESY